MIPESGQTSGQTDADHQTTQTKLKVSEGLIPDLRVRRHIPALDGLRGTAILLVVLVHLAGGRHSPYLPIRLFADLLRLGWAGVVLFFVLSGFLITGILWDSFREPGWWRRFYWRRSLRIFPLYYLALLYALIVSAFLARDILPAISVYALYLQDFPWFNAVVQRVPVGHVSFSAFWSLAVEEQFYLIWPFLLFACRKRRGTAMWICGLGIFASLLFRLTALHNHVSDDWSYRALPARCGELLMGAWIALAVRSNPAAQRNLFRFVPPVMAGSALALVALTFASKGSFEIDEPVWLGPGITALAFFAASLMVACLRPGLFERVFSHPGLRWFGSISYGLYIFQGLLTPVFRRTADLLAPGLPSEERQLFESFISLVGSVLLAWLSFNTYERYFLRMKDRTGKPKLAAHVAA